MQDPFNYTTLPGWSQQTIRPLKPMAQPRVNKWQAISLGVGSCFLALFIAQFMLAIASGDLKGYRARSLDLASASSVLVSCAAGFAVWRKVNVSD